MSSAAPSIARQSISECQNAATVQVATLERSEQPPILAGNLSYQIEHHLFPDLPAHRYGEISDEVREIRERYGIPDNTGPLHKQFGSVVRTIVKLALPPLPGV